ncbi:MAG: hypothetical protein WAQ08_10850 [Aquabacterium sp.]|uniref:hypothetical protein n=1 Tax=Aquabacterium sp. TaxID=1872578 RepID=UPI003BB121C0
MKTPILAAGVTVAMLLVVACGSGPAQRDLQKEQDPIAAYRRDRPVLQNVNFQDFGALTDDQVALVTNPTLEVFQARHYCQEQPVERLVEVVGRARRCARRTDKGCAEYEGYEQQPACTNRSIWTGTCYARADPNSYAVSNRKVRDCYWTPADADVAGKLTLYAVPENASRNEVARKGRVLGSVALAQASTPQTIALRNLTRPRECLALVDAGGQVVDVRSGSGPQSHLFASAQMIAETRAAEMRAQIAQADSTVERARFDLERLGRAVATSPAWKDKRCMLPPTDRTPPEPKTLRNEEASVHARGYCMLLLMHQTNANAALDGAAAAQRFDHIAAARAFGINILRTAECTRQSHTYDKRSIDLLNGEVVGHDVPNIPIQMTPQGILSAVLGVVKPAIEQGTLTGTRRTDLIAQLLDQCTNNAQAACTAERTAWEREVLDVKAAPAKHLKQCETDMAAALLAVETLKKAEAQATMLRTAAPAPVAQAVSERRALSAATCSTQ